MFEFATRERRRTFRRKTLKGGRVVDAFSDHDGECAVRNLTPGGARLTMERARMLPSLFQFEMDWVRRPAEWVWQSAGEIGIRFLDGR